MQMLFLFMKKTDLSITRIHSRACHIIFIHGKDRSVKHAYSSDGLLDSLIELFRHGMVRCVSKVTLNEHGRFRL